jgi:hypothetical protein
MSQQTTNYSSHRSHVHIKIARVHPVPGSTMFVSLPAPPPAGTYYTDEAGVTASQGFLRVGLQDVGDDRRLVIVTTHLKVSLARVGPGSAG